MRPRLGIPPPYVTPSEIQVSILHHGRHTLDASGKLTVSELTTLGEIVQHARASEALGQRTEFLRNALAKDGRTVCTYDDLKAQMPAIIPAACAPAGARVKGLSPARFHNELYGYDIDEDRQSLDLHVLRAQLIAAPGAVLVGTSCAGDGLFVIFAGPRAFSVAEYKKTLVCDWGSDATRRSSGQQLLQQELQPPPVHLS